MKRPLTLTSAIVSMVVALVTLFLSITYFLSFPISNADAPAIINLSILIMSVLAIVWGIFMILLFKAPHEKYAKQLDIPIAFCAINIIGVILSFIFAALLSAISVWIVYTLIILVYATAFTLALVDLVRENKKALNIQQNSLQQAIEKSSFNYNKIKQPQPVQQNTAWQPTTPTNEIYQQNVQQTQVGQPAQVQPVQQAQPQVQPMQPAFVENPELLDKIMQLDILLARKIITKSEYEHIKQSYIKEEIDKQ